MRGRRSTLAAMPATFAATPATFAAGIYQAFAGQPGTDLRTYQSSHEYLANCPLRRRKTPLAAARPAAYFGAVTATGSDDARPI
jgi:hypothetical protein